MGHEVRHDLNSIMSFHEAKSVLCWSPGYGIFWGCMLEAQLFSLTY